MVLGEWCSWSAICRMVSPSRWVQSAWHQQNTGKMHDFGLRTLITAPVGIPISGPNRPETLENTAKKRFDLLIPERLDPYTTA